MKEINRSLIYVRLTLRAEETMERKIILLLIILVLMISCQKKDDKKTVIDENISEQIELPPLNDRQYGQIVTNNVEVHLEPITDAQVVTTLEIDKVVLLLRRKEVTDNTNKVETWYNVYTSNQQSGWINEKYLFIPNQNNESVSNQKNDNALIQLNEYLIQSEANGTADITWYFYKNLTFKLSVYLLELDTSVEFNGNWKLENNIIYITLDLDSNEIERDTQNIKALFTSVNPKLIAINTNQAFVEIDISTELNWIWIYGINCSVKIL